MYLFVVGVNHKTASLDIREHVSRHLEKLQFRLRALKRLEVIEEWCLLSTCNRVELYGVALVKPDVERLLARFTVDTAGPSPDEMKSASYILSGSDTVFHLMKVATGLDSMVLGEGQIGGQARKAFKSGQEDGTVGPILGRLFSNAMRWAKKAREQSGLERFVVDVAYAAVQLARRIFGSLSGLPVAIVGSGEMGQLALTHLQKAGIGAVTVLNRTLENAESLAETVGGRALSLADLAQGLAQADVVISSTGAKEPIITVQAVEKAMERRVGKPLFILDVAVPRDVEEQVNHISNVYVYNVDDLQGIVDANLDKRKKAAAVAEEVINEGVVEFTKWLRGRRVGPLLAHLEEKAEEVVKQEFARVCHKLNAEDNDKEKIKEALRRVAKKLIHPCLTKIRLHGGEDSLESNTIIEMAATLFGAEGKLVVSGPEKEKAENDPQ